MAYYLNNASSDAARITLGSFVSVGSNVGDYVEFSGFANAGNAGNAYRIIGRTDDFANLIEIVSSNVNVRFSYTNRSFSTGYTQPAVGQDFVIRVEKISSTEWEVFLDTVSIGIQADTNNFDFNEFFDFANRTTESFRGGCYYIEASTDGGATVTNFWDPSATSGTGTTLEDTAGTNDGTLNSFAGTTDSWWVFYSGGGGLTIITSPIVSGEVVGSPTFTTGTVLIDPVAIATAESVGNPTIAFGVTVLNPTAIASVELVGEPVVVPLGVVLQPVEIVTEEVVGTPVVVTGLVFLIPDSISTEEAVGEPFVDTLLKQIFPTEILSLEDVGRPSVFGGDSIIIPIESRQTWNAVAKYLRALVFTGADNDVIQKWLLSEGYDEAYNDNWLKYLEENGFTTGNLTDGYAGWRNE